MAVLRSASTPRLRQRHFPSRRKSVIPSTKPNRSRQLAMQQSTLTQLNYIIPSSCPSDDDEISEPDAKDSRSLASRKRRKINPRDEQPLEEAKQSTLTQWDWLERDSFSEDSEDAKEEEKVVTDKVQQNGQLFLSTFDGTGPDTINKDSTPQMPRIKRDRTTQAFLPSSSPASPNSERNGDSGSPPGMHQPSPGLASKSSAPSSQTPKMQSRQEIPSSQSPPPTPLTTQDDSPIVQRTPLQEIPHNVIEMMDERSSHRRASMPRQAAASASEQDKENFDDSPTRKKSRASPIMPSPRDSRTSVVPFGRPHRNQIPSSQATTVDITQQSAQQSSQTLQTAGQVSCPTSPFNAQQRQSVPAATYEESLDSPTMRQPTTPMAPESQYPFSCISGVDNGDYSPLSSIHDSAELVSVSQLLPESMINDSQESDAD